MQVEGWARAETVTIELGAARVERRPDRAGALSGKDTPRFTASLPVEDAPLAFELTRAGRPPLRLSHAPPVAQSIACARRRLALRFWADLLPHLPMIALGLVRADSDLPRRVKLGLRLTEADSVAELNPAFFASPVRQTASRTSALPEISLIMPVFNAFELLEDALSRVSAHTDLPWRLILVVDGSTDGRVRPWLRDWVAAHGARHLCRIVLLEIARYLGFVQSVNRAFALIGPGNGPVVLINNDALVPPGWASRLTAPLADPAVASVTPLSNDAEIFSVPAIATRTALAPGQGDAIDAALRARASPQAPRVAAPTGVGFCMALSADWLARIGGFDPAFGRGYGEEVDWCQRARAAGGQNVVAPDVFVEHRGGASFRGDKHALLRHNAGLLRRRYPGYDRAVQRFIRDDPLVTARLMAALAWAESLPGLEEIPVFIAHSMGGGAERYLSRRLESLPVSVVLRFGARVAAGSNSPHQPGGW